eukprot:6040938-Pleurochrysis_carterae.AAC.1
MPFSTGGTNNVPKLLCDVIGDRHEDEYVVELNVGGQIIVHGEGLTIDALPPEEGSNIARFSTSGLELKGTFALDVEDESGDFVLRESATGVVYIRVSSQGVSIPLLVGGGGGSGGQSLFLAGGGSVSST